MSRYESMVIARDAAWAVHRLHMLMELGVIGLGRCAWRALDVQIRSKPESSPVFYLPEVDPVTRQTTGRPKTFRLAS